MTMTCVDQTMIRRGRWRAVALSGFAALVGTFASRSRRREGKVEDLSDDMLRDIGFFDGRATEAAMRRAAEQLEGMERF